MVPYMSPYWPIFGFPVIDLPVNLTVEYMLNIAFPPSGGSSFMLRLMKYRQLRSWPRRLWNLPTCIIVVCLMKYKHCCSLCLMEHKRFCSLGITFITRIMKYQHFDPPRTFSISTSNGIFMVRFPVSTSH